MLKDKISIRAIQIVDGKVYYVGTDSKLGYVHLKDTIRKKKQVRLSKEKIRIQNFSTYYDQLLYTANIESPFYFYKIDKEICLMKFYKDTLRTAFMMLFSYDKNGRGIAISDPTKKGKATLELLPKKITIKMTVLSLYTMNGEAHFAASNTNIATVGNGFG